MISITDRLIGAEIEYMGDARDDKFDYVDEYYRDMREVNSILLPCSDIQASLGIISNIFKELDNKTRRVLGTYGWINSYGIAYNGAHLHLSGDINSTILRNNILKVINKWGFSPRTVTSWHIFNRPTNYSFKNKIKHSPVYNTPRGTTEIRVLDLEYFMNDEILVDLGLAIEAAYNNKNIAGSAKWAATLTNMHIDDVKACLDFMDTNRASWWDKLCDGAYKNNFTDEIIDFRGLDDWRKSNEMHEPPIIARSLSGLRGPARPITPILSRELQSDFSLTTFDRLMGEPIFYESMLEDEIIETPTEEI